MRCMVERAELGCPEGGQGLALVTAGEERQLTRVTGPDIR